MGTTTYKIDQAHGADDVGVMDWNNSLLGRLYNGQPNPLQVDWNPADTKLQFSAPGIYELGEGTTFMDACTARVGLIFRNISLQPGESLVSAKLRLWLESWDPPGTVDPESQWTAQATHRIHCYGAKVARPYPGLPCPGPGGPPFWGPAAVRQLQAQANVFGDYAWHSGFNAAWPEAPLTQDAVYWTMSLWDYTGQVPFNQYADAWTFAEVPRGIGGSPGWVEWDVTAIVAEMMAHQHAAPNFVSGTTYSTGGLPKYRRVSNGQVISGSPTYGGGGFDGAFQQFNVAADKVMSGGNLYVAWCKGQGIVGQPNPPGEAICTNPPTGTDPWTTEWPDGSSGIGWRFVQSGNVRNAWQSGDQLAFVLASRAPQDVNLLTAWTSLNPPGYAISNKNFQYQFSRLPIPGWRVFTSGDANIPTQAPSLVIETAAGTTADIAIQGASDVINIQASHASPSASAAVALSGTKDQIQVGATFTPLGEAIADIALQGARDLVQVSSLHVPPSFSADIALQGVADVISAQLAHVAPNTNPDVDPLAHWRMDDSDPLVIADAMGHYPLTVVRAQDGAPFVEAGKVGNARRFRGVSGGVPADNYAWCDADSALCQAFAGTVSLCWWLYRPANILGGLTVQLFSLEADAASVAPDLNRLFNVQLVNSYLQVSWESAPNVFQTLATNYLVLQGRWVHLAAVRPVSGSNAALLLYVNGLRVYSVSEVPAPAGGLGPGQRFRVGHRYNSAAGNPYLGQLDGTLDDVRLYPRVLTAEEIAAMAGVGSRTVKAWDGQQWVVCPVRAWDGSRWVDVNLKG